MLRAFAFLVEMDGEAADLFDWELLLASPAAAAEPCTGFREGEDDAGAIKHDYFDLGSDVCFSAEDKEEEATSGNASWVEPDPDDLVFHCTALWSDSSSDGERHEEAEVAEPLELPVEEDASEGAVAKGGVVRWWHLPMGMLRAWALRAARSAWSVPVAVALLGIVVLGRRLYRMRRQSKAMGRVRLVLDKKKASQFKAQAPHLNGSILMARRAPMIKHMLPVSGVTLWPVLGHI
ncbi:hypothetical protein GUJ93_ZPchr0007g3827 [Zizania palustris]|uniref:Uncharacterized protein n=1 Tax=Zizania palustris TaxID=103762 RepID=A0A8J5SRE4_ZIZPA|nr:hypothetical protein GUJ93_ZPchr0007g3827 [Zizania palustris]